MKLTGTGAQVTCPVCDGRAMVPVASGGLVGLEWVARSSSAPCGACQGMGRALDARVGQRVRHTRGVGQVAGYQGTVTAITPEADRVYTVRWDGLEYDLYYTPLDLCPLD